MQSAMKVGVLLFGNRLLSSRSRLIAEQMDSNNRKIFNNSSNAKWRTFSILEIQSVLRVP